MISLRKIKALLFICVLIAGVLTSCKKDKDVVVDPSPDKGDCRLTEMNYGSGTAGMKTTLTYNTAKQLAESHTVSLGFIVGTKYTYTDKNQVAIREEYYGPNKESNWKTTYTYTNNQLTESKAYMFDNGSWTLVEVRKHEYQDGKMTKIRFYSIDNGTEVETAYKDYSYDANNNVSSILGYELNMDSEWVEATRRTFTYAPKSASWALVTSLTEDPTFPATQLFLTDRSEEWDEVDQKWTITEDLSYSYTYNDKGLPITVTEAGTGTGSLVYTCY